MSKTNPKISVGDWLIYTPLKKDGGKDKAIFIILSEVRKNNISIYDERKIFQSHSQKISLIYDESIYEWLKNNFPHYKMELLHDPENE